MTGDAIQLRGARTTAAGRRTDHAVRRERTAGVRIAHSLRHQGLPDTLEEICGSRVRVPQRLDLDSTTQSGSPPDLQTGFRQAAGASVIDVDVEAQVGGFINKFAPPMQDFIRGCRARMAARFPHAVQLVYDNYNFFVIGFGPSVRPSDSVFSLACQRKGINLCFLQHGPDLPDPTGILRGSGHVVRSVRISAVEDLDRPDIIALMDAELARARVPMEAAAGRQVIVKSVSAKQRPRQ